MSYLFLHSHWNEYPAKTDVQVSIRCAHSILFAFKLFVLRLKSIRRFKTRRFLRVCDPGKGKETSAAETCLLSSAHGLTPPGRWCEANQNSGFVITARQRPSQDSIYARFWNAVQKTLLLTPALPHRSRPGMTAGGTTV